MAIQLIENSGGTWLETRTVGKLSHTDPHSTLSRSLRANSASLTVAYGWQEATWEAAKKGSPFSIDGIYSSHDIGFCNVVAAAYGYGVTVHRGLAAFSPPAEKAAPQLHARSSP